MNASVHPIRTTKSAIPELNERFNTLQRMVRELGEAIDHDRAVALHGREARAAVVVELLAKRGVVTVSDVKRELKVTMKTANRLLHHVSHAREGVLVYEPIGGTDRLVLFHPDRVVIDDPRPGSGQ